MLCIGKNPVIYVYRGYDSIYGKQDDIVSCSFVLTSSRNQGNVCATELKEQNSDADTVQ